MIMNNNEFATKIYEFLKDNNALGYFEDSPAEDCIEEFEQYLSNPHRISEIIKDIEKAADMLYDHEYYVTDVKPLLQDLREIQGELEVEQHKRMVSDTGYEVKNAINIGAKEILFAEDKKAENGMCWFVGDYTQNEIVGQYTDCQVSDDFLEAMQEFTDRVSRQIEVMKSEINQNKTPCEVLTAEHCYPDDRGKSIDGKIVAIRADALRPEYRRGDVQLVLVSGGSGARANSRGNSVFCYHLNDGGRTRFDRYDVQGEVKPEHIPKWATEKAAEIMGKKMDSPQKNARDREGR